MDHPKNSHFWSRNLKVFPLDSSCVKNVEVDQQVDQQSTTTKLS